MTALNNIKHSRCRNFLKINRHSNHNSVDDRITSASHKINKQIKENQRTINCNIKSSRRQKTDKSFKTTQIRKYFESGKKINKREFFLTLKKVFGKRLANKIKNLPRFKYDYETRISRSSSLTISQKDAFLALLAIGQHVSIKEIGSPNYIVNHGHQRRSLEEVTMEAKNPSSYLRMGSLNRLMRRFNVSKKDLKSIYSTINHVNNLNLESGNCPEHIIPYKSTEILAREIAYIKPESLDDGIVISFFNKDSSKVRFYYLKEQLHDSGLHAYYFKPLSGKTDEPGLLLFRGTKGLHSLKRDINIKADTVGKKVFDRNQRRLLEMTQDSTSLNVIGHSLGGADVQRYLLASALNHEEKQVTGYAYCAPKLDQRTLDAATNLEPNINPHNKVSVYFARHQDDLVPKAGNQYIGREVGIESQTFISSQPISRAATNVFSRYLGKSFKMFDRGGHEILSAKGRLQAHCDHFFNKPIVSETGKFVDSRGDEITFSDHNNERSNGT